MKQVHGVTTLNLTRTGVTHGQGSLSLIAASRHKMSQGSLTPKTDAVDLSVGSFLACYVVVFAV